MFGEPISKKELVSLISFAIAVFLVFLGVLAVVAGALMEKEGRVSEVFTVIPLVLFFLGFLFFLHALYRRKVYIFVPIFCFAIAVGLGKVLFSKPDLIVSGLVSITAGLVPLVIEDLRK